MRFILIIIKSIIQFSIAAGMETFSHVSARIWNAVMSKINVKTSISKFMITLK